MPERYKVHICPDGTGWGAMNAAYRPRWSAAEAADGVADQLGPDYQADNSHDDRIVLAHPVAQAGQDPLRPMAVPIWSPGLVSHHAAEAEMTG